MMFYRLFTRKPVYLSAGGPSDMQQKCSSTRNAPIKPFSNPPRDTQSHCTRRVTHLGSNQIM